MNCPECKGKTKDGKPYPVPEGFTRHIHNIGGKQKYPSFDTRRYICLCCGFSFVSKEEFFRPISSQSGLFDTHKKEGELG